jgi:peptidoglycan/xylan/chitin deacetylase (PgdA/CDA1 family)
LGGNTGKIEMRSLGAIAVLIVALSAAAGSLAAAECDNPNALGISRTLTVDPTAQPLVGTMSYHDTLPLADHEVVLTLDDGPLPPHTGQVLDILAAECVKATYFMVGQMATAFPDWARKVAAAGHTVGTHSQSHPLTFHRMPLAKAQQEIDDGFASVQAALGDEFKVAPFFRYPGLLHQANSEAYLADRHIMAWSADVPGDDWKRRVSAQEIIRRSVSRLEDRSRGILLLHDIHKKTVAALPGLLAELKARGFKIVHVVPGPVQPAPFAEPDDAVASAPPAGDVIADPQHAASQSRAPAVAMAKIEAAANPLTLGGGAAAKDMAALADAAARRLATPPVRAKAAISKRAQASHVQARLRHAKAMRTAAAHGPVRAHRAAQQAQPSTFQQSTAPKGTRACANCRHIRVKKAHLVSPRSG